MTMPSHSPDPNNGFRTPRRSNTITSITHSITRGVETTAADLLHRDPPLGFFAATAEVAAHAPTIGEIRRGNFGSDGWNADGQRERRRRTLSQSSTGKRRSRRVSAEESERSTDGAGGGEGWLGVEGFPTLTEEPGCVDARETEGLGRESPAFNTRPREQDYELPATEPAESQPQGPITRTDHNRIQPLKNDRRVYSSGYIPPPTLPWTTSTLIAYKAFGKWFCTPFGFLLTVYGLNVVAWGGMLFLLLCNAAPAMCWAPIHNAETERHYTPAVALALSNKYPLYRNCNDINSPRRIWLEIDSQILNALFCVTGFGLIPWRFRDWYYLLLWRFTSSKRAGRERKAHGLRVLAGIYNSWVRLPDSRTLDHTTSADYQRALLKQTPSNDSASTTAADLEAQAQARHAHDLRIPLPISKAPEEPLTGIRAPPTALWKIDFFVWSQVLNTFLQACLCGFMWGYDRYARPSWATGFFIALACSVAGAGGLVSFLEGKKVKRVEGVAAKSTVTACGREDVDVGMSLEPTGTGCESVHVKNDDAMKI